MLRAALRTAAALRAPVATRAAAARAVSSVSSFVPLPPPRTAEELVEALGDPHYPGALDVIFNKLDANGDGLIQPEELRAGFKEAGLEIEDAALQKLTDAYGGSTGSLKIPGLLAMLTAAKEHRFHTFEAPEEEAPPPPPPAVHYVFSDTGHFEGAIDQAFNAVDKNEDGAIDRAELSKELERRGYDVSPEKVASLFSLYANEDGVLKVMEFAELAANLREDDC